MYSKEEVATTIAFCLFDDWFIDPIVFEKDPEYKIDRYCWHPKTELGNYVIPYCKDPETDCAAILCDNVEKAMMMTFAQVARFSMNDCILGLKENDASKDLNTIRDNVTQKEVYDCLIEYYEFLDHAREVMSNFAVKDYKGHKLICFLDVPYQRFKC